MLFYFFFSGWVCLGVLDWFSSFHMTGSTTCFGVGFCLCAFFGPAFAAVLRVIGVAGVSALPTMKGSSANTPLMAIQEETPNATNSK